MKLASGKYLNMYNEAGYEDYEIPGLDIVFLFPESYSSEECLELFDEIEEKTRKAIVRYKKAYDETKLLDPTIHHIPFMIKYCIEKELDYLDLQILVKCS